MEISHTQFQEVIQRCYDTKVPVDIKGATGIGKSEVIKQKAKQIAEQKKKKFIEWNEINSVEKRKLLTDAKDKFLFVDIRLSQLDPTDLKGLINFKDEFVEWKPQLLWMILSNPEADGIVFFDEANLASPSVLAACYQIINDRQCGENPISKDVLFISAGNQISDKAHVYDEPAPLKNRRLNYILRNPYMDAKAKDDWGKWAAEHDINPGIISFLYFKPSYLHKFDKNSKESAFPTPRGWVRASKLITGIDDIETIRILMAGNVGEGVAAEYISYLKVSHKINIRELLKDPELVKQYTQLDMKFSIVSGITEIFKNDQSITEQAIMVCNYMEPDFGMYMLRMMKGYYKNDFSSLLMKTMNKMNNNKEIYDRLKKYMC